ncbi:OmpA family protein [Halospina denitrificans]|uniref:OmpA family protein n=1 Tax=Halospina denitrificans TaxID=332522 RepID=A0A4R7K0E7_9GAMM|nr:outer membrane beta-barrel protein [Halospina denitrificans]TDT43417.1 OmpA family protein [Halospina denitrificans]
MNRILPGLAMATALCSFQVAAADNYEYPYTGISGGSAELTELCDGAGSGSGCDDSANFYRIYSGARLLPAFGFEVGYTHTDNMGISTVPVRPRGIDLTTLFHLPMGNRLDVFAKAGAFFWDMEVGNTNDQGSDVQVGAGIRFGVTESISLRADYDYIPEIEVLGFDVGEMQKISGAVEFHF